jgi:tripartite-type tricarboxylate transporter receptor subunit TctC
MEEDMPRFCKASTTIAAMLLAASLLPTTAAAQGDYPAKPIRIVLPIPPGTALDIVTRVVAEHMTSSLGQQILVEPRPGAGGLLAAQAVGTAPADGYTLLGGASGIFTILPAQKDQLPIDMGRDFTHVGMIVGRGVMFLAVPPKLGIKSFPEFAALAKSKPGEIVIGTNGAGTLPHYAGLLLQRKGGLPITLVPYNQGGTPAAVADIMGGRVHATIEAVFGIRGPLQSSDLQLIGAMSAERDPDFSAVPTVAETLPGLSAVGFMSLAAPAKTPESIVRRLNESLNQALATPAVKQRFAELGVPISIVSATQATAFVNQQRAIWLPLVKELEGRN